MSEDKALLLLLEVVRISPRDNEQILLAALPEDHSPVPHAANSTKKSYGEGFLFLGGFSLGQMTDCHVL
jgi:hypothetical protein